MKPEMNYAGYLGAREKLANMEARLEALRKRADLHPSHRSAAERSYIDMIRQYKREIKLYEMHHPVSSGSENGLPAGEQTLARERLRQGE